MSWWDALLLGLVQGLSEFLPISSSGHLVLAQAALGLELPGLTFDIMLHFGTLLAVLVAFRSDIGRMVADLVTWVRGGGRQGRSQHDSPAYTAERPPFGVRLIGLLVVGTIPAGALGLLFQDRIEALFQSEWTAGVMLVVTGTLLWLATRLGGGARRLETMSARTALGVGVGQAMALLPGLSRSGTTLIAGMLLGVQREEAARLSFLLAIPTIAGATLLGVVDLLGGADPIDWGPIAVGVIAAAVSGFAAIRGFLRLIGQGRLIYFSYYTWTLGALVILWKLFSA